METAIELHTNLEESVSHKREYLIFVILVKTFLFVVSPSIEMWYPKENFIYSFIHRFSSALW